MDIPEQIFVGIGSKNELKSGNSKLSIAKRVTGKSPDEKAIESIKKWCNFKNYSEEPHLIDNVPTQGFKIDGFTSRYSTDNKWFEIIDPRGFKLQVNCQNLMNILKEEDLVKGVIQSECVWGFDGSPYLVGIHSKVYANCLKEQSKKEERVKITGSKLEIGKLYSVSDYGEYTYMYLGRATFVIENISYTRQHLWNRNSRNVDKKTTYEAHNTYLFAAIYDYKSNWNDPCLDVKDFRIKATKSCPKVWETDKTTIHDQNIFIDEILISGLNSYRIPDCAIDKSISGYGVERKLKRFAVSELGVDKTF
jgi:hypothetical protein